jgi:thiamine-monophosphate kinase
VGEFELLAKLRARLGRGGERVRLGAGDDAAITVPGGATATSVDAVVDGVHFQREVAPLRSIGHKALAAGLSDLAAMGAEPGEAYIVLGLPRDLGEDAALELHEGIEALARTAGVTLAGGDITRSPALMIAVTVVGHASSPEDLVRRDGAAAGEVIAVTGELGGAAAGLRLLQQPHLATELAPEVVASLRSRQLEPFPRLAEGRALARAGATALIDISDGLGADGARLAEASGVRLEIELERAPFQAGVRELAAALGQDPFELLAGGGEDYELLACIPADRLAAAESALARAGGRLTAIGRATAGSGVALSGPGGRSLPISGFDQLA